MAAVTVTRRRTNVAGARKIKTFTITVAADGDTLDTRLKRIEAVSIQNPLEDFTGEGTLVGGTVTVTDARITANSDVIVTRKTVGGAVGHLNVAPGAGSAVITSSSGTDTSVVMWEVRQPQVKTASISGGTLTFKTMGGTTVTGAIIRAEGN